jgi:hypothetical protein
VSAPDATVARDAAGALSRLVSKNDLRQVQVKLE